MIRPRFAPPRTPHLACASLLLLAVAGPATAQTSGEALNADDGTGAVKVCAPVAMPRWRSMTPVPKTWTFLDCMSFSGEMGATHFQLGCLFTNVTPYAQKYAWGPMVQIAKSALAKAQPPMPNCGW
ncbi:hypothetical protein ACLBX9_05405 [Methylobacterium sp. A49B]|uniref:Uncharacterized protein n=1 Tax=Methylobacterium mesophilicum SR1.6/6 TaxID=908290 RepID=A0A6B9FWX9_9HYPH|nr:hypothetical protein [Methylobacterium mesophilicum]QGY05154.1 hypothetical protein MMSR116_27100 [Methylobacterium mesophilicum SR1.6/6]